MAMTPFLLTCLGVGVAYILVLQASWQVRVPLDFLDNEATSVGRYAP